MIDYSEVKCPICGVPWDEHSVQCAGHFLKPEQPRHPEDFPEGRVNLRDPGIPDWMGYNPENWQEGRDEDGDYAQLL